MILGNIFVEIKTGTLFSPPSEMYDKDQQTSVNISSWSFSTKTLHRLVIDLLILLKSGDGLPLTKLDRAQLAFLTKDVPDKLLSKIDAIGGIAPELMTMSLIL